MSNSHRASCFSHGLCMSVPTITLWGRRDGYVIDYGDYVIVYLSCHEGLCPVCGVVEIINEYKFDRNYS